MKKLLSGLLGAAWLVFAVPVTVQAGEGTTAYKPGVIKSAVAKGETTLVIYKASW